MTVYPADRLFSRPSTITEDERARVRQAYEECPLILDAAIYAALGTLDHGDATVEALLRRIRCTT